MDLYLGVPKNHGIKDVIWVLIWNYRRPNSLPPPRARGVLALDRCSQALCFQGSRLGALMTPVQGSQKELQHRASSLGPDR